MRSMRGDDREPDSMFSYVSTEQRIPKEHPLRAIRTLVDDVLHDMSREFDRLYAAIGRPSVPPERLLRAQLLQIFYSIRSERLLMEQLDYNGRTGAPMAMAATFGARSGRTTRMRQPPTRMPACTASRTRPKRGWPIWAIC